MKNLTKFKTSAIAALMVFGIGSASAETGVSADAIKIGMSNALTGPASALGIGVKTGASVYIDKINAAGGVNGRKINLVSYDDGYEPANTEANTKKLIENDQVFLLFGYVGTPTSQKAVPVLSRAKVPYVGPFTGAEFLRKPLNKQVFNVRGSYFDEVEAQIEHLTTKLGKKNIGIFIQDDGYGNAVKAGVVRSLRKRNMKIAGEGKYTRNTVDVDAGVAALKGANPDAVIMVGTYKACAAFVKKAKASGFNSDYLNVSFVGTNALISELGSDGEGVFISQVMPSPDDASVAIVKQYQDDMGKAGHSQFDYTSLEGYIDAVVLVNGLKKAGADLTRVGFIAAMETANDDIGGLTVSYNDKDHQGLGKIYLTKIQGGKAVSAE